jgi:hypothetical protein
VIGRRGEYGEEGLDAVDDVHAEHLRVQREGETRHGVHAIEREVGEEGESRREGGEEGGRRAALRGGGGLGLVGFGGLVLDLAGGEGGLGGVEAAGDGQLPDEEEGGGEGGQAGGGLEEVDERGGARLALGESVAGFVDDDGDEEPQQCWAQSVMRDADLTCIWWGWAHLKQ